MKVWEYATSLCPQINDGEVYRELGEKTNNNNGESHEKFLGRGKAVWNAVYKQQVIGGRKKGYRKEKIKKQRQLSSLNLASVT